MELQKILGWNWVSKAPSINKLNEFVVHYHLFIAVTLFIYTYVNINFYSARDYMQLLIIVKRTEGVPTIRNIRLALGPFIINMRANIEEEAQTYVF